MVYGLATKLPGILPRVPLDRVGPFAVAAAVLAHSAATLAQQANVNLDWNLHKNTQNLTPYGANVISPRRNGVTRYSASTRLPVASVSV